MLIVLQDGESITPAWSPRFRINGRTLRIRSMYSEDAGIYECKGVNGFGSQMARTRLIVSGKLTFLQTCFVSVQLFEIRICVNWTDSDCDYD